MSKVFMISDPHFGHKSMSEKRGFKTVEEHDEFIVDNWNSKVTKRDKVFLLGDITMEKSSYNILEKLKGNITVVLGNHDLPNHSRELLKYVDNVAGAIRYKGCILTHIPIHDSEIDRFRLNIHGHIHEGVILDYRYFNVSCESINYIPIEFNRLIEIYLESKDKNN